MICKNCGSQLEDYSAFCQNCGSAVEAQPQEQAPVNNYYAQPAQKTYTQQANYSAPQPNYQNFHQGFNPMVVINQFISDARTAHTLSIVSIIAAFFIPIAGLICGILASSKVKKLPVINEAELDDMMRFQYYDARKKADSAKKLGTAGWIVSIVVWIGSIVIGVIAGVAMASLTSGMYYY